MNTQELSDRLVDAYALLTTADRTAKKIAGKRYHQTLVKELKEATRKHFIKCVSDLRHESFSRRGILPHGQNGSLPLYPEGTRPHSEVYDLAKQLIDITDGKYPADAQHFTERR